MRNRKNQWSKNDKSGRRSLSKKKRIMRRQLRAKMKDSLTKDDLAVSVSLKEIGWRKRSNTPLAIQLKYKWSDSSRTKYIKSSPAMREALRRLKLKGFWVGEDT